VRVYAAPKYCVRLRQANFLIQNCFLRRRCGGEAPRAQEILSKRVRYKDDFIPRTLVFVANQSPWAVSIPLILLRLLNQI